LVGEVGSTQEQLRKLRERVQRNRRAKQASAAAGGASAGAVATAGAAPPGLAARACCRIARRRFNSSRFTSSGLELAGGSAASLSFFLSLRRVKYMKMTKTTIRRIIAPTMIATRCS
jgi:hypothetical protein